MFELISESHAENIIKKHEGWIDEVSRRYGVPAAAIKAILFKEMIMIDIVDIFADLAVLTGLFSKKDSSTGYAQIYGSTGLTAANFALDRGLSDYSRLGIRSDHRLDRKDPKDVRFVWMLLRRNRHANIELATINILSAADEMTGRTDMANFSEEEMKLTFTRYNANTRHITPYGEDVYKHYLRYQGLE